MANDTGRPVTPATHQGPRDMRLKEHNPNAGKKPTGKATEAPQSKPTKS